MTTDARTQYDAKKLLAALPDDHGELFLGYRPGPPSADWRRSSQQTFTDRPERIVRRSVWDSPDAKGAVLIDVTECASSRDAIDELMERLDENQLQELDRGPERLGATAFRHPPKLPPALFFAHANLVVSIVGHASADAAVDAWLEHILQDVEGVPKAARRGLELELHRAESNDVRVVRYSLPWQLGDEGWFKFAAQGATLERAQRAGELRLGRSKGKVSLRGWAIERDKEPYAGSLELD